MALHKYFSKRHEQSLETRKLKVSIPSKLRVSILRILENFSRYGGDYNEDNITFLNATETLKTFYGSPTLMAYEDDKRVDAQFEDVIRSGWPPHTIDCIEAWFDHVPEAKARACEKELNAILDIHQSPWRFVNSSVLLIDSDYLRENVVTPALTLMVDEVVAGAFEEFRVAHDCLLEGRTKDAVVAAHKSLESVMKTVLNIDHATFGELIARLIKNSLVPAYYSDFMVHLEKLLLAAGKERNLPGRGHGQGREALEVATPLAEFAINLVAVMNLFLLKRWVEKKDASANGSIEIADEDIPF